MENALQTYGEILRDAEAEGNTNSVMRYMARNDLFFLLTQVCKRKDLIHPFMFARSREVQRNPNGRIDLWAREHGKSSIISFGLTIQDILNNPNITNGIFSFKFAAASFLLKQIRTELGENELLKELFQEILYDNPKQQAPAWSEASITVKRTTNRKECTIEANGLIDALPTGKHYDILLYDDIVNERSITTDDQIKKTMETFEHSLSLGTLGGNKRIVGTFYGYNDAYTTIIERDIAIPRIYTAIHPDGTPVFFTEEYLLEKKRTLSPYIYSCQYLLDPKATSTIGFKSEWLRFWTARRYKNLNIYIFVDPASSKTKRGDYTSMIVVGIASDGNYYIIDMVRDKLSLVEKAETLMVLHRKYRPKAVYYEKYGMMGDIEHIKYVQARDMYRFSIKELGGKLKKEDRIQRLIPLFKEERIYIPDSLMRTNIEGVTEDLTKVFISEYNKFPFAPHDDMLDALSRICDEDVHMSKPMLRKNIKSKRGITEYSWENIGARRVGIYDSAY